MKYSITINFECESSWTLDDINDLIDRNSQTTNMVVPLTQIIFPTLRNSDCIIKRSKSTKNHLIVNIVEPLKSLRILKPLPLGVKNAVRCIVFANSLQECLDTKESVEDYLDKNSLALADFQLYKAVVPSDITRNDFDMIFVHPEISPTKYSNLISTMLVVQPQNKFDKGNIITLNL